MAIDDGADLAELRRRAGLQDDLEQHVTLLRRESRWPIPFSVYLAWDAGDAPVPRPVRQAAHRLAAQANRTQRTAVDHHAFPNSEAAASIDPESHALSDNSQSRYRTTEARLVEAARVHYEQMYRQVGGVVTGDRIKAFLSSHSRLTDSAYSDTTGREIYRSWGGLIAIVGICAYDSDAQDSAEQHFLKALAFARASGDRPFGAYVYGLLANQALLLGKNRRAVEAAEAAITTARQDLSNALRADLRALQAKAFARTHDNDNAIRNMKLAEDAAKRIQLVEEPPETGYIQPGLIEEQLADTLRSMGDLPTALSYAERSLTRATHGRGRANRLVILTRIAVERRDLEYAADTTRRLLVAAQGMESLRFRQRLRAIRKSIEPYQGSVAVRDVAEELDTELMLRL
jgi:hypothetical protein